MSEGHEVGSRGNVTVEVIDLVQEAESGSEDVYPAEKIYHDVTILPSGWLRCAGLVDEPDEGCVDLYPPERVNGVYAIVDLPEDDDE